MNDLPPPYRPLRGASPPHFVDRHDEDELGWSGVLAGTLAAYEAGPADPRFHRLVWSAPAMGKTALLRAVEREVGQRLGWPVVHHRCRPKEATVTVLAQAVVRAVAPPGRSRRSSRLWDMSRHPSVGWPGALRGASAAVAVPDRLTWSSLGRLLACVGAVCRPRGAGLVVAVDDADRLGPGEAEALAHLCRTVSGQRLPVAFLMAGGGVLAERVERAQGAPGPLWLTRLGPMDDPESREAVVVPAAERGVEFEPGALELLCRAAGGSPLDLQRLAAAAWSLAPRRLVRAVDAEAALARACLPERRAS